MVRLHLDLLVGLQRRRAAGQQRGLRVSGKVDAVIGIARTFEVRKRANLAR
jgi:hypothetical protein